MKTVAQKTGINNERLRNHSSRKAMIQALNENDSPPTHITLLSGHKNLKSIENYSKVSTKQQMQMSKVLSSVMLVLQPRRPRTKQLIQPFVHPLLNNSNLWLYSVVLTFKVAIFPSAYKHSQSVTKAHTRGI